MDVLRIHARLRIRVAGEWTTLHQLVTVSPAATRLLPLLWWQAACVFYRELSRDMRQTLRDTYQNSIVVDEAVIQASMPAARLVNQLCSVPPPLPEDVERDLVVLTPRARQQYEALWHLWTEICGRIRLSTISQEEAAEIAEAMSDDAGHPRSAVSDSSGQ